MVKKLFLLALSFFCTFSVFAKEQEQYKIRLDSITIAHCQHLESVRAGVDTLCTRCSSLKDEVMNVANDLSDYTGDKTSIWLSFVSIVVMIVVFIITYCLTKKQIKGQEFQTQKQIDEQRALTQQQIDAMKDQTQKQIDEQRTLTQQQIDEMKNQTQKQIDEMKNQTQKQIDEQRALTQQQIDAMKDQTQKQINEQRNLTQQQIDEMRTQSIEKINTLNSLGENINVSTSEIRDSVKQFELKYLVNKDQDGLLHSISTVEKNYETLKIKILSDYSHFNNQSKNKAIGSDYYETMFFEIRSGIDNIRELLSRHVQSPDVIPDEEPYIESIRQITLYPNFELMDEQIDSLMREGEKYHQALKTVLQTVFNNK